MLLDNPRPNGVSSQQLSNDGISRARIGQREPLLYEVNALRGLQRKRWPAGLALWGIRRDELDQRRPRHYLLQLF